MGQVSAAPEIPAKLPETPSSEVPPKQPEDVEMKDVSSVNLGETPSKTPVKGQPLEDALPVDPLIKKLFTDTPTPSFSRYSTAKKEVAGLGNNRRFGKKPRKIVHKTEGLDKTCKVHHLINLKSDKKKE